MRSGPADARSAPEPRAPPNSAPHMQECSRSPLSRHAGTAAHQNGACTSSADLEPSAADAAAAAHASLSQRGARVLQLASMLQMQPTDAGVAGDSGSAEPGRRAALPANAGAEAHSGIAQRSPEAEQPSSLPTTSASSQPARRKSSRSRRHSSKQLQRRSGSEPVGAKHMFLANISHEIRTPLNGMLAVAQLLRATNLTPEQRELADMLSESGETLLSILGDILDFSKIDSRCMTLQSAPLDLRGTLEASLQMVAADAARKGLALAYSLHPALAAKPFHGDALRIRQVLANLLANAVKFTENGEVVTTVMAEPHAEAEASGRQCIHIKVRDTGIGIDARSMAKLFRSFQQAHESMARKYGGTGLGLAISRQLAQLMGGTVWAESREGEGSTFHFTMLLPCRDRSSSGSCSNGASSGTPVSGTNNSSGLTRSSATDSSHAGSGIAGGGSGNGNTGDGAVGGGGGGGGGAFRRLLSSASSGDTSRSDTSRGDTSRGDTSRGDSSLGMSGVSSMSSAHSMGGSSTGGGSGGDEPSKGLVQAFNQLRLATGEVRAPDELAVATSSALVEPSGNVRADCNVQQQCEALKNRTVVIDVAHRPTAVQVYESCMGLGMLPTIEACSGMTASREFAIVGDADKAVAAFRGGWKGRPVIALGCKENTPIGMHPLLCAVSLPVRHARLAAALLRAHMLMRHASKLVSLRAGRPSTITAASLRDQYTRFKCATSDERSKQVELMEPSIWRHVSLDNAQLAGMSREAMGRRVPGLADAAAAQLRASLDGLPTLADLRAHDAAADGSRSRSEQVHKLYTQRLDMAGLGGNQPNPTSGSNAFGNNRKVTQPVGVLTSAASQPVAAPPVGNSWTTTSLETAQELQMANSAPPAWALSSLQVPRVKTKGALNPRAAGSSASSGSRATLSSSAKADLPPLRILVAEDNLVNQKVVLRVLQSVQKERDFQIQVVDTGAAVLAAMRVHVFDLILMDIHMPEMDGLQASTLIQQLYAPADRPKIVAVSADTLQVLKEQCERAGISDFITKPFRVGDLQRVISNMGSQRVARQSPPDLVS